MATLLLRLAGPMQSWGVNSKLNTRGTSREPSKSAIVGMVAAALGRSRDESVVDISALKFGVRIDQPGTMIKDYHTAHNPNDKYPFITYRYYLSDAIFIVGLEGDRVFIEAISSALRNPYYPLSLGRRSCPPSGKLVMGISEDSLLNAIKAEPWQASDWYKRKQSSKVYLEISCDSDALDEGEFIRDVPESFSQSRRSYSFRKVERNLNGVCMMNSIGRKDREVETTHDALSALKGE